MVVYNFQTIIEKEDRKGQNKKNGLIPGNTILLQLVASTTSNP